MSQVLLGTQISMLHSRFHYSQFCTNKFYCNSRRHGIKSHDYQKIFQPWCLTKKTCYKYVGTLACTKVNSNTLRWFKANLLTIKKFKKKRKKTPHRCPSKKNIDCLISLCWNNFCLSMNVFIHTIFLRFFGGQCMLLLLAEMTGYDLAFICL